MFVLNKKKDIFCQTRKMENGFLYNIPIWKDPQSYTLLVFFETEDTKLMLKSSPSIKTNWWNGEGIKRPYLTSQIEHQNNIKNIYNFHCQSFISFSLKICSHIENFIKYMNQSIAEFQQKHRQYQKHEDLGLSKISC
jgi:hypothetical protein